MKLLFRLPRCARLMRATRYDSAFVAALGAMVALTVALNGAASAQSDGPAQCSENHHCPKGYYCAKDDGDCDGKGECQPQPDICPHVIAPVCGCDGNTYSNSCIAASNGVNVAHDGECGTKHCEVNEQCPDGFYCDKKDGDCDGRGVCAKKPVACPHVEDPVCGCDGKTYGNACFAAANGANVAHEGACPDTGPISADGCKTNFDCPFNMYCAKDVGDCDGVGTCAQQPQYCLDVWDPVCGCDGNTYSNWCYAARVGVNVDFHGTCGGFGWPGPTPISGDDSDGPTVGTQHLLTLIENWGRCGEECPFDLSGNERVDATDVLILIDNWGQPIIE